jgi:adenine-specific DNA-methyltransferase
VYDPSCTSAGRVAFENHLNYYHLRGTGLPKAVAKGLAAFLNSTLVDSYFRQFSGHTQVNATDLRSLRYPSWEKLVALGRRIGTHFPEQENLDPLVEEFILHG